MLLRVHRFATTSILIDAIYARIAILANDCLEQHSYFSVVLAGGTTPRDLYRKLCQLATDWSRWQIYFGDERCLPAGDPGRNDTMAASAWLEHVAIPQAQIHRVPQSDNTAAAAAAYALILQRAPGFDLVLLGLGEDGHTASLFPGDPMADHSGKLAIAINNAPKPPPQRVSMSPECLSSAAAVWFIVSGGSKRPALEAWLGGAQLPPQSIKPRAGVDIFTDIPVATEILPIRSG